MGFRAVMFDLDGTLADTLRDIAAAGNHALTSMGRSPLDLPRYRQFVGWGIHYLIEHALATDDPDEIDRGVALSRGYYAAHGEVHTRLYPGIAELLDGLTERGIPLAVFSNKPDPATRQVVDHLLSPWRFADVRGAREGVPLKPDPTVALDLARQIGVPAADWIYVGDSEVDMETASAAGMFGVGVLWGFREEPELRRSGAKAIIRRPTELLSLL